MADPALLQLSSMRPQSEPHPSRSMGDVALDLGRYRARWGPPHAAACESFEPCVDEAAQGVVLVTAT